MCLASRTTNLLRLGIHHNYRVKSKLLRSFDRVSLREQDVIERTIRKAIHLNCNPELADKAIHGYRRSAGGDAIAEQDFQQTDQPYIDLKRDHHYRRALRVTERLFRPSRQLKPIAFPDLRFYPWNLAVSAEYPYTDSPDWVNYLRQKQAEGDIDNSNLSFHNLYNEIFDENRLLIHKIKEGERPFWTEDGEPVPYGYTNLHVRSHLVEQDEDDKLRAVFGVPKLLLMAENMFIWNLQREYLNHNSGKLLWGFETMRGGWAKLYKELLPGRNNSFLSTDWSKFDKYALHEVIDDVHSMWRGWFDFDSGYEPTDALSFSEEAGRLGYKFTKTNGVKIQRLWDWMTHSIKHTPIRGTSGNVYQWQFNGIASGYQQTQLLDSFYNTIMLLTCLSASGINIESDDFRLFVQGDDSACSFPEFSDSTLIARIAREAKTRFNAVLSDKKSILSSNINDMKVLSYKHVNGISYREPSELLAHLLYPERPRDFPSTAAACIGIAYSSMGCNKQVYNTCKDAYLFITNVLKRKADFSLLDREMLRIGLTPFPRHFPTFEECYLQNFNIPRRTEKQKQRLWPSKPTGRYGFFFYND